MTRFDINRSGEMEVFVRVVEEGGFSAAARAIGLTPSAVSKLVARMEARLGVRLLNRSTRALKLTTEGCLFYERARRILTDMDDAERETRLGEAPAGQLRLSTSASYAVHVLAPILPRFLEQYPGIALDMVLTDRVLDLVAERVDVAVRAGPLKSSSLVARKLGETPFVYVATPAYLDRYGVPQTLEALEAHTRIGTGYTRASDGEATVTAAGRVRASDGEAMRQLALAGCGIARLAAFTVREDIAAARLVALSGELTIDETETFHAVHVGQGGPIPSRVRVLLDFLAEHGRIGHSPSGRP